MSDSGHAGIELALAVGLLLVPVALAVTAFAPWSERRVAAEAIASEAARAVVLDLDHAAGEVVVAETTSAMGLGVDEVRVGWCAAPTPSHTSGICPLERGGVVTVSVALWTPLVSTPWGGVGGLWVSGTHSEPIDLYRSLE